jgi:hypothetical protein
VKAYKIEMVVVDFDGYGPDEILNILESGYYPVIKKVGIKEADLGEWSDSHPLNQISCSIDEALSYFPREDELEDQVDHALDVILNYGSIDGAHHKQWVLDKVVRALMGPHYDKWVADHNAGEDGPNTYEWDEGIAP